MSALNRLRRRRFRWSIGNFQFYVRYNNRIQDAKDVFGVFIGEMLLRLPDRGVLDFYIRTKPSIEKHVARVGNFLIAEQRYKIDDLWKEYRTIPFSKLLPVLETEMARKIHESADMDSANPKLLAEGGAPYRHPRDVLKDYLEVMISLSQ